MKVDVGTSTRKIWSLFRNTTLDSCWTGNGDQLQGLEASTDTEYRCPRRLSTKEEVKSRLLSELAQSSVGGVLAELLTALQSCHAREVP